MKLEKIYKVIVFIVLAIGLTNCSKDSETYEPLYNQFAEKIFVDNPADTVIIMDTIWFSAAFNDRLVSSNTQEAFDIKNATFAISGVIESLWSNEDSILFINENFEVVEQKGEVSLVNVFSVGQRMKYGFDISCSANEGDYELKFGIVCRYKALFSVQFEGVVFHGENRDDFSDYSDDHNRDRLIVRFGNDNVNDSLYYGLSSAYQWYDAINVINNRYYFFEVVDKSLE